jgi:2-keto-4-pentenoate hydratase/2-oxohepta-3-ene-1,7-dioic acid hydratase in catechol pathway
MNISQGENGMALWIRYEYAGTTGFGTLDGQRIAEHEGDLFASPRPNGRSLALSDVRILAPCVPGKMPALWNNFHARAAKEGLPLPADPLVFLKGNNAFCAHGDAIRKPAHFGGRVIFEGELGIVIGKRMIDVAEADAPAHIFGYTIVNDVTAVEILRSDKTFEQWTRSKSFDTFCPIGPVIATGIDPDTLTVRSLLDGQERQNYPVADMIFRPARLASLISRDMTLEPGDIIACGTSVGAGSMKPGSRIEIAIDGIGVLSNPYVA